MRPARVLILSAVAGIASGSAMVFAHLEGGGVGKFPGVPLAAPPAGGALAYSRSHGVRVLGHADPGGGFNADVVAHRGFAYLASWGTPASDVHFCPAQGVRIYDLSDPTEPTLTATFGSSASEPDLAGTWTEKVMVRSVKTRFFRGDLAVASLQACYAGDPASVHPVAGFGVWDVTDPHHPRRLGLYQTGTSGVHELWLEPRGKHAYVYAAVPLSEQLTGSEPDENDTATVPGTGDFRIIDVTDPGHPTQISSWGAWRELGIKPFPDENFATNFAHSVIGAGNRAYVSYWDLGTLIFDVANPAAPRLLGRAQAQPQQELHAHSSWLAQNGNLLVQTSEDFSPYALGEPGIEDGWGYVRFLDVSNPARPRQVGTFEMPSTRPPPLPEDDTAPFVGQPPGYFSVHDPKVVDQTAFFSWYSEGVVAVDIRHPGRPQQIAQFVPEPAADPRGYFGDTDVAFPFVWGTFPYRGYVLAADINSGLWVFELDDAHEDCRHTSHGHSSHGHSSHGHPSRGRD